VGIGAHQLNSRNAAHSIVEMEGRSTMSQEPQRPANDVNNGFQDLPQPITSSLRHGASRRRGLRRAVPSYTSFLEQIAALERDYDATRKPFQSTRKLVL